MDGIQIFEFENQGDAIRVFYDAPTVVVRVSGSYDEYHEISLGATAYSKLAGILRNPSVVANQVTVTKKYIELQGMAEELGYDLVKKGEI